MSCFLQYQVGPSNFENVALSYRCKTPAFISLFTPSSLSSQKGTVGSQQVMLLLSWSLLPGEGFAKATKLTLSRLTQTSVNHEVMGTALEGHYNAKQILNRS